MSEIRWLILSIRDLYNDDEHASYDSISSCMMDVYCTSPTPSIPPVLLVAGSM